VDAASEDVWIKTHRLCGKLMVGGGLLMLVAALLPVPSGVLATICAVGHPGLGRRADPLFLLRWRREGQGDQASL
jgi:hypothetical protein